MLIAIRDAESRTRFLGYRVENYQAVRLHALGRAWPALPARFTCRRSASSTRREFAPANSIEAVIWVAVGGRGTLVGAALGAVLVNYGQDLFHRRCCPNTGFSRSALLFILVTLFLPQGIVGLHLAARRTIPPAPKGSDVEEGKIDQSDVPAAAR